jgi:hypothetical protein
MAMGREVAMQKVVGSSPITRSETLPFAGTLQLRLLPHSGPSRKPLQMSGFLVSLPFRPNRRSARSGLSFRIPVILA